MAKIVHIMHIQKFIPFFIEDTNNNFNNEEHLFCIVKTSNYQLYPDVVNKIKSYEYNNIFFVEEKKDFFILITKLYEAKKIILHSIWLRFIINTLFLQPWLLKKSYWVMWGGDFNGKRNRYNPIKRFVIKYMGYYVTYIKGDYEYIKKYFNAKGTYIECFMYDSNLYHPIKLSPKTTSTVNIQVGNSGVARNNHIEIFEKLKKFKEEDIKIFTPLGYGSESSKYSIIKAGRKIFGNKYEAQLDFLPFEEYLKYLSNIDIAIFGNKSQQAMGTIISLLGLGVKVYIRSDITPWKTFKDLKLNIFDVEELDITPLSKEDKLHNINIIKNHFSKENYLKQLEDLFSE